MSSKDLKIWFDSQFCRMNCQIFSWPLSSGARGGSCKSEMLLGTLRALAPSRCNSGSFDGLDLDWRARCSNLYVAIRQIGASDWVGYHFSQKKAIFLLAFATRARIHKT